MKYFHKKSGFTLVEILIAISILSISILATFTAVSQAMKSTNFAEDQITAYYLADEALEYIRNQRDVNSIKHIAALGSGGTYSWVTGITGACGTACYIDPVAASPIVACPSNAASCPVLLYNPANGLYQYAAGGATIYRRSVTVTTQNATEIVVTVTVSWTSQSVSKSHIQTLVLKNWTQ